MKRTTAITIVLTALALAGAIDVVAQNQVPGQRAARRGPGVEAIMQMRDRLELTDQQIADLETIRRESVDRRNADQAEMAEMRSRVAAGQAQRSDLMALMEDRREANAGVAEQRRALVEGILTETQLQTVQQLRGNARAFARGRLSARRGQAGFRQGRQDFRGARRGIGTRGNRSGIGSRRFDGSGSGFGGPRRRGPGRS